MNYKILRISSMTLILLALNGARLLAADAISAAVASEFDLVIDAMPRQVEIIGRGAFSDAIEDVEGDFDALEAIVAFRVLEVHKVSREEQKEGNNLLNKKALPRLSPSNLIRQISSGKLKEIVTGDPGKVLRADDLKQRWFRIAVRDPYETFGVTTWSTIEKQVYRIYLNEHDSADLTYTMVKSELL